MSSKKELQRPSLSAGATARVVGSFTDVHGLKVGHFTETRRPTGCTVVLCEHGATAGVDVRGGAPGTRETDLLNPINTVEQIHGLVLSGGSAFGLDAASGVVRYLAEKGVGFNAGPAQSPVSESIIVPIIPAAILIDLEVGDWRIRPTAESGYQACQVASTAQVAEGNVGAGAGATVGKFFGARFAMKGGLGTASLQMIGTDLVVAAMVAVNAAGDIYDPQTAEIIAGARTEDGKGFRNTVAQMRAGYSLAPLGLGKNSTIGTVATNAKLTKAQATKIAQMAHDGLARTINPLHTPWDGDTIFALGTGTGSAVADVAVLGTLAADVLARAVVRAITQAQSIPGYPSYRSINSDDAIIG